MEQKKKIKTEKQQRRGKRNYATVKKFKKKEKEYTSFFVGLFLLLFVVIGFIILSIPEAPMFSKNQESFSNVIDSDNDDDNVNDDNSSSSNVFISNDAVTLYKEDVMSKFEGINSTPHVVTITNNKDYPISYRIRLVKDPLIDNRCDCGNQYSSYVWVFVQGTTKKLDDFSDSIILEGELDAYMEKDIFVYLWFDKSLQIEDNNHFHGKFELDYTDKR